MAGTEHRNLESKEDLRYLDSDLLTCALRSPERPLILKNKFKDHLVSDRLFIRNFDFCKYNDVFEEIDFSNCVLSDCDLSYLVIEDCCLATAELIRCQTQGIVAVDGKNSEQAERNADKKRKSYLLLKDANTLSYRWLNSPDFTTYINGEDNISIENGFYNFVNTFIKEETLSGWKFHISVHPGDIEKAFDLAAPILFKTFRTFKQICLDTEYKEILTTPDAKLTQRMLRIKHGRQITIYTQEDKDGNPTISPENIKLTLGNIRELYKKAGVRPGIIPSSDAAIDEYVSLRNDRGLGDEFLSDEDVRRHYNPLNRDNPYAMLIKKPEPFSLLSHFNKFQATSSKECMLSFKLTLFAYIAQYFDINLLSITIKKIVSNRHLTYSLFMFSPDSEKLPGFDPEGPPLLSVLQMISNETIPKKYFKEAYRNDLTVASKCAAIASIAIEREKTWPSSLSDDSELKNFIQQYKRQHACIWQREQELQEFFVVYGNRA